MRLDHLYTRCGLAASMIRPTHLAPFRGGEGVIECDTGTPEWGGLNVVWTDHHILSPFPGRGQVRI